MRENGFYWVLTDENVWVIAEYQNCTWYLCGIEEEYTTKNFVKIGQRAVAPASNNKLEPTLK